MQWFEIYLSICVLDVMNRNLITGCGGGIHTYVEVFLIGAADRNASYSMKG